MIRTHRCPIGLVRTLTVQSRICSKFSIADNDSRKSLWKSSGGGQVKGPTPPTSLKKSSKRGGNGNGKTKKHSLMYGHDPPSPTHDTPLGSQQQRHQRRNKDICLGFVAFISSLTFCLLIYTLVELHSLSISQETLKADVDRLKMSADTLRQTVRRQSLDSNLLNMGDAALRYVTFDVKLPIGRVIIR